MGNKGILEEERDKQTLVGPIKRIQEENRLQKIT